MTTTEITMEQLRYPTGRFSYPENFSETDTSRAIETIETFPAALRKEVNNLNDAQADTPYRDGGWTIRQVVHHLADSHLNAYTRFKLALTEENPAVKPYDEAKWAELSDAKTAPMEISLRLLEGLHSRWALLLRGMTADDFRRTFYHPENKVTRPLSDILALYEWHCRHHLAHITSLKKRMGW